MKKSLLLLFISLCWLTFAQAQQNYLVIDDFEDGNTQNTLGGYWYTFNDNQGGGKSHLAQQMWPQECLVTTGGHESKGMLVGNIELDKGTYQWSPYYAFATKIEKTTTINPANFVGLTYWHKGAGHKLRIETEEVIDYDFYQIPIPTSASWKLITIDFSMLTQGGWGKKVNLNLDNSINLVWNVDESSGSFQIDDIRFIKELNYFKQNDLVILPAKIPDPVMVKGNVTSTLNTLSKKYLTKGMNLTNWGESNKILSSNTNEWKYNAATIKLQADQGMLGIRFPIDLDLYIKDRLNVLNGTNKKIEMEPILYTVLDSMNSWTKKYSLSLTIDYHAYDGTFSRMASKNLQFKEATSALWGEVAKHFKNEQRQDLFYELTNEPCLGLPEGEYIDQADWTSLAQMMIDSIRKVDKTRPIIFGDTKWYSLDELVKNKPFTDKYIIYSFHMYDPFIFTHQGASWTNMGSVKNIPFPYSPERWSTEFRDFGVLDGTPSWVKDQLKQYYQEGNKQYIKNRLAKVKNWAFDHNVPLICNEWGALPNTSKIEDLNAYFKTMGEIFVEMDISWQVWFGIMDHDNKLLPGMAEALDLKKK